MKHGWTTFTLVLTALVALAGSALGETWLCEYFDSEGYGTGTRIQLATNNVPTGVYRLDVSPTVNAARSLWDTATVSATGSDSNGIWYIRWKERWRDGRNSIFPQGGGYYLPVDGPDGDHWNVAWTNVFTNNASTLENWYKFGEDNAWVTAGDGIPTNGIVANDGVGLEEINWALMLPASQSWFPTNYLDLPGSAQAIAFGVLWNDLNTNGFLNNTDDLLLKYAVVATNVDQATAFAEMDTPEELNEAVGNVLADTNSPPAFNDDPFSAANALADAAYSSSIAGSATDIDGDPLTFSKLGGSAWLSVAGDGGLSGAPASGDLGVNSFTVQVSATGGTDTATMTINVIEGLKLVDFRSISDSGDWEVSIAGLPGDVSKLVEAADDIDFDAPEQDPVPMDAVVVGSAFGDEVIHDAAGNTTVQVNLGAGDPTSAVRAEETGGITFIMAEYLHLGNDPIGLPLVQLSDGTNALGSFVITNRNANPKYNLSAEPAGGRYGRVIADFRASGEIEAQGALYYSTVSGTNLFHGPWINVATNPFGAQVSMSTANWNDSPDASTPPDNGFTPDDGVGQEEINWVVTTLEGGFGTANAIALGFLWTDNDADGLLDLEDTYTLKYTVGVVGPDQPSAFEAMDTEEELNAAVGNVP